MEEKGWVWLGGDERGGKGMGVAGWGDEHGGKGMGVAGWG